MYKILPIKDRKNLSLKWTLKDESKKYYGTASTYL